MNLVIRDRSNEIELKALVNERESNIRSFGGSLGGEKSTMRREARNAEDVSENK